MHRLIVLPAAARFIKKIKYKSLKSAFLKAIDEIIKDPYIGELKTGDLSGIFCHNLFFNKVNYEIAYTIIKEKDITIVIILAGTRENFYNQLKRYMK